MAAALGIDQRALSTTIFALGAGLAGLGGALVLPDTSANTQMDLAVIVEAFVVVVVGGMGSVTGAFLASLLIGELQAFGIVLHSQGDAGADFRHHGRRPQRAADGLARRHSPADRAGRRAEAFALRRRATPPCWAWA